MANYTAVMVSYQKQNFNLSFFTGNNRKVECPQVKIMALNGVRLAQIMSYARRSLCIAQGESFQLFLNGKMLTNMTLTVGSLRDEAGQLKLMAISMDIF